MENSILTSIKKLIGIDEDYEYYVCEVDLDEDEMQKFLSCSLEECPYYQPGDEYLIVRKQM